MLQTRRMRQRAATISATSVASAGVAGWYISRYSVSTWRKPSGSSQSSTSVWEARKPNFRALREEMARPSGVLGPRDLAPLMREDSALDKDGGGFNCSIRPHFTLGGPNSRVGEVYYLYLIQLLR